MKTERISQLNGIVQDLLLEAERACEISEDYCWKGALQSQQEYAELASKSFSFPNCNDVLSEIRTLHFSDAESEEFRISEITSLIEDVVDRITAVRVIYSDLINLITYPHDGDTVHFALLTGLSIEKDSLLYKRNELQNLMNEMIEQAKIQM